VEAIQQLAELGVILLMFGIGLHFSLHELWLVRDIAIPGAVLASAHIFGVSVALGAFIAGIVVTLPKS
jgi:CPA2 family monovalent cation:H+ antiporter-2